MNQASQYSGAAPPLVSIVVPTCNRREVLGRCMEALAKQTYPNFEVIVVDDGSTDDTPQFLERFAAEHPRLRFRWLRNEHNIGANPSRNRGIREASGEFVAFEDNDCIAQPEWLERLMNGFSSDRVAAVTGLVRDLPPGNIYELCFKGTHRVAGVEAARRLVAGNMCVRRELLLKHLLDEDRASQPRTVDGTPDVTVSGRGDEEGLFLSLRAAGYEQRVVPDAVVLHEHHYTARSFFRQAYAGGGASARLVYKYHLPPRVDMLPFMLTYVTLPLIVVHGWAVVVPAFFFLGALAAITYNDLFRKGKTIGETIRSFPVLVAYYHVRMIGYVSEAVALRVGRHRLKRQRLEGD